MNATDATRSYEQWLSAQIAIVSRDLEAKHSAMDADRFAFLRATYYRWAQQFPELDPEIAKAPVLLAVGDLHFENFGTWRDERNELVWGVNDFDERERLPYTNDLVRLATSALFAVREGHLALEEEQVCPILLEGYRAGLNVGGQPFILEGRHRWLGELAAAAAKAPERWWRRLERLPPAEGQPAEALTLIEKLSPGRGWEYSVRARVAGLGSLGHRRLLALGPFAHALAAREVKQLAPPAGVWLGRSFAGFPELPIGPGRAADPLHILQSGWVGRRLAPDSVKLDLADYTPRADQRVLNAMGFETANIHLCDGAAVSDIRLHVDQLPLASLTGATRQMATRLEHDWHHWRRSRSK